MTTFSCTDNGDLIYRGTHYGSNHQLFRGLRDVFASDPSDYAKPLVEELDAALARFEQIAIEEVGE